MTMRRTFRFVLRTLAEHRRIFFRWLEQCRILYNMGLEQRRAAYQVWKQHRNVSVFPTKYGQMKELTELREEGDWSSTPALVQRSSLVRLDEAFKHFLRGLKQGKKVGYPRFKGRDRYDSFGLGKIKVRIQGGDGFVTVPKLGQVRFRVTRQLEDGTYPATIKYDKAKRRWWLNLSVDLGEAPPKTEIRSAVGIDLGLKTFAVLSDGSFVDNPRFLRKAEESLARAQQTLALKKRGSKSRAKAKRAVQLAYSRVRNRRADFAWKLARRLVEKFDLICFEKLSIMGMLRSNLAKSVGDAAWAKFIHCLTCKAEEAGKREQGVNPRGTTQECSRCGTNVPKTLAERVHRCPACGLVVDRDLNAAWNILARGLRAVAPEMAPRALLDGCV